MARRRLLPHQAEEIGDDDIRFFIGQLAKRGARLAAFEHYRMETGVGLEEPDGGAAVPESETVDLVLGFHVWHAELQHSACAVAADRRRNPRAGGMVAPRLAE